MSAAVQTYRRPLWLVPAAGLTLLLALALTGGIEALAAGWLAGWLFCLSASVGASVWLMIHALTGGRWIGAGRHVLVPLAALTPLAALAGLPLIVALPQLYPWWPDEPSLRGALYLNAPAFGIRAAVILAGWSIIGLLAGRMGPKGAAAGLIFHALVVGIGGLDWMLSRDPDFGSTTFGALWAVLQLAIAVHVGALALRPAAGGRAIADWGALMLACVLGAFYFAAMQFLVSWSGNLPDKASWYLARQSGGGFWLAMAAFVLGAVLPFAALLPARVRTSAGALRVVALPALLAALLWLCWICAPGEGALAAVGALGLVALLGGAALVAGIGQAREEGT